MLKIFCFVILIFQASFVWAESWTVQTSGPMGDPRETRWETRRADSPEEVRTEFFLTGGTVPLLTVLENAAGTKIELASGETRHFAPGFLVVTDLPMPLVIPLEGTHWESGTYCQEEYSGALVFKTCTEVALIDSLEGPDGLSVPQGKVLLVQDDQGVRALLGSGFRIERHR